MSLDFMEYLKENEDKKNPVKATTNMFQHPTGFMYMDYGAGSILTVYDDDEIPITEYHNVGITSGSVTILLSKTQGGKTTLAVGMGMAIIEPYIRKFMYRKFIDEFRDKKNPEPMVDGEPFIHILDTEKTLPIDYVKKLTKYKNSELKKHVLISHVSTDKECIKALEAHIKYKVEHMSPDFTPMRDIFGSPMKEYPPTVCIIDSVTQLVMEELDDPTSVKAGKKGSMYDMYESATKGSAGAQRAKVISALYSQLVNYAKKYNIIIFAINHINKMPAMMGIPVKQARFLKSSEFVPGGERPLYLAANVLRLDVIKNVGGVSSTSVDLGKDIKGHISIAAWLKSKSNSRSNSSQLVYTTDGGYDPLLSTIWNAKEIGHLSKAGNFYYLDQMPNCKFTMKNVKDVFAENPGMFGSYYDQFRDKCSELLDDPEIAAKRNRKMMEDVRKDIHEDHKNGEISKNDAMDLDDLMLEMVND